MLTKRQNMLANIVSKDVNKRKESEDLRVKRDEEKHSKLREDYLYAIQQQVKDHEQHKQELTR